MDVEIKKQSEPNYDSDKFKFLYEYKKYHLDMLRDDYKDLENKATKYLTFVTLILTMASIFLRDYLTLPVSEKGLWYYSSLVLLIMFVIAISPVLRWLFLCIKINKLGDLPKEGMKPYFLENIKETVYIGTADRLDQIIESYKKLNMEKAAFLKKAFEEIKWSSLIFIAFVIVFLINKF